MLPTLPPEAHSDANKVQGCASQVLDRRIEPAAPAPILHWRGDSDAPIVRGLIALLLALFSGKPASEVLAVDALAYFGASACPSTSLQRSNGVRSMVERIRSDARMERLEQPPEASGRKLAQALPPQLRWCSCTSKSLRSGSDLRSIRDQSGSS